MEVNLIERPQYLDKLKELKDKDTVKVLAGVRRSGKSSLLKMLANYLKEECGVDEKQFLELDLDAMDQYGLNHQKLYNLIAEGYNGERMIVFVDEVKNVRNWEKAIASVKEDFDCDIYVTGSSEDLLSGEILKDNEGKYDIIQVYPLSFQEYLDFLNYEVEVDPSASSHKKYSLVGEKDSDNEGEEAEGVTLKSLFNDYIEYGGFPEIVKSNVKDVDAMDEMLNGIYLNILVKDMLEHVNSNKKGVLETTITFLADNIGSKLSANKVKNALVEDKKLKNTTRSDVIKRYINVAARAYLVHPAKRYDVKRQEELATLGKFYIADTGIRELLTERENTDRRATLENLVFMELKRRDFDVNVGKSTVDEITFVAHKDGRSFNIQVTPSLSNPKTFEQIMKPMRKTNGSYKRLIITEGPQIYGHNIEGIEVVDIIEFLLDESILT